jgi:hypothetical protein
VDDNVSMLFRAKTPGVDNEPHYPVPTELKQNQAKQSQGNSQAQTGE